MAWCSQVTSTRRQPSVLDIVVHPTCAGVERYTMAPLKLTLTCLIGSFEILTSFPPHHGMPRRDHLFGIRSMPHALTMCFAAPTCMMPLRNVPNTLVTRHFFHWMALYMLPFFVLLRNRPFLDCHSRLPGSPFPRSLKVDMPGIPFPLHGWTLPLLPRTRLPTWHPPQINVLLSSYMPR